MAGQLNELLSIPQHFLIHFIEGYTKIFSVTYMISTSDAVDNS